MDKAQRVRRIAESILTLPTLPTVIAKMLELVDNPRTSAQSLATLILQDQVLTARLLKLANSSFYGFPRQIATVKLAIVVLGFDNVKEMALSLSVLDSFRAGGGNLRFDIGEFWRHSVAVAAATRLLAREARPPIPAGKGEAFVAGLLHDIGKLILNQYLPAEFARAQELAHAGGDPDEAEVATLGAGHAEVGAWLAERWNLPKVLVDAIRHHSRPWRGGGDAELALLVHLGDQLASACRLGDSGAPPRPALAPEAADLAASRFGWDWARLEALRPAVHLEYDKASGLLEAA